MADTSRSTAAASIAGPNVANVPTDFATIKSTDRQSPTSPTSCDGSTVYSLRQFTNVLPARAAFWGKDDATNAIGGVARWARRPMLRLRRSPHSERPHRLRSQLQGGDSQLNSVQSVQGRFPQVFTRPHIQSLDSHHFRTCHRERPDKRRNPDAWHPFRHRRFGNSGCPRASLTALT